MLLCQRAFHARTCCNECHALDTPLFILPAPYGGTCKVSAFAIMNNLTVVIPTCALQGTAFRKTDVLRADWHTHTDPQILKDRPPK